MKVRKGFVTNSSSSSFIIDKKQLSYGQLLKYLLKIANKEVEYYDSYSRRTYKWKDVEKNCVAGRYNIIEATKEKPYIRDDDFDGEKTTAFEHHYVINNGGCGRYDWDAIDEILKRHNIDWEYGNCD